MKDYTKTNAVTGFVLWSILLLLPTSPSRADTITGTLALEAVGQYEGQWSSPPTITQNGQVTDAPLLGNGNVGVIVFGGISAMSFAIDKNEYWSLANTSKYAMANLNLSVSGMTSASYSTKQVLMDGLVAGSFTSSGNTITTNSWVQATDATNNLLITQISYSGSGSKTATVSFAPAAGNTFPSSHGTSGSVVYMDIAGDTSTTYSGYSTCQVRCAATVIGATPSISNNQFTFTMSPGNTYTVVSCIMSNYDSSSWQSLAISNISSLTGSNITSDLSSHEGWWNGFWEASYVMLSDQAIEKEYYGSLYLLASASRAGHAPPGLWGPWSLPQASNNAQPDWNGDYHLNYDFQVPYLGALTANHPELLLSYSTPILYWLPQAESAATSNGYQGAYYCVGIGPLPNGSGNATTFHNQKSNGAYSAQPMIAYFNATKSTSYATTVYPFMKEAAAFWQSYLSWNGTSYDILDDAQQEDDSYPQTNGTLSLGLVHYLFQGCISMANALNTDSALVSTWTTLNSELSPYPTFTYNGVTVFRETSVGTSWVPTGNVPEQMIYPGDQIGPLSSSSLLTAGYNSVDQADAWDNGNAYSTIYAQAAHVLYPPTSILSHMDGVIAANAYHNMGMGSGGGGMETSNVVPGGITEMMMQSFQGTILIFPDWPTGSNAKFGDLLANGDFLVSSGYENGSIQYVRIVSQAGGTAVIRNPWPGQTLAFYKNGASNGTLSGTNISISTTTNDVDLIAPNGTSYNTIINEMETPAAASSLGSDYNIEAAVTDGTAFTNGGIGGSAYAYSATLLGPSITWNGATFALGAPNSLNGVTSQNIGVPLGQYSTLNMLGTAVYGNQTGQTITVNYTDGTSSTFTQSFSDWAGPQSYSGESTVANMAYRNTSAGTEDNSSHFYLYGYSFALNNSKTVSSITLPLNPDVDVLGISLTPGSGANGLSSGNIADAIVTDGTTFSGSGGLDGDGYAYSSTLLGSAINCNSLAFKFLAANGSNGVSNETVTLAAGSYSTLSILGTGVNGNQSSQTFQVNYTDGSHDTFTQSLSDWFTPQNYAGESIASKMAYRDTSGGTTSSGPLYLYEYSFAINSAKTVSGLVLPANRNVVAVAINLSPGGGTNGLTSSSCNISDATVTDGTTFSGGGIDGGGDAYSATQLGSTLSWNGLSFTLPAANGANGAANKTVTLPSGMFSSISLLATAVNGNQTSQTFKVNYTNGTNATFTQSLSDWGSGPQGYSGESTALTMTRSNHSDGSYHSGPATLYGYTFPLNNTLTVQSIVLPANSNVVVLGIQLK